MHPLSQLKFLAKQVLHRAPRVAVQQLYPYDYLGTEYGGWPVLQNSLSSTSVVYSFGIGEDISFDRALIAAHGCTIHGFDPTPKVQHWLAAQTLPPGFIYHQCALANQDGTIRLFAPRNPDHVSHSIQPEAGSDGTYVEVPAKRLATLASELGHQRIDVLKMDIEGFEYGVIDELTAGSVEIPQLLIEFHHTMYGIPVRKTETAIRQLNQAGYQLFYISNRGQEFGFVKA